MSSLSFRSANGTVENQFVILQLANKETKLNGSPNIVYIYTFFWLFFFYLTFVHTTMETAQEPKRLHALELSLPGNDAGPRA